MVVKYASSSRRWENTAMIYYKYRLSQGQANTKVGVSNVVSNDKVVPHALNIFTFVSRRISNPLDHKKQRDTTQNITTLLLAYR